MSTEIRTLRHTSRLRTCRFFLLRLTLLTAFGFGLGMSYPESRAGSFRTAVLWASNRVAPAPLWVLAF